MAERPDQRDTEDRPQASGGRLNPLAALLAGRREDTPAWLPGVVLGVVILVALLVPYIMGGSDRWLTLFTIVLIYVVLASGLNIVVGFTGLLDLGYVAFYAIGGYYGAIVLVMVLKRRYGVDLDSVWYLTWINLLIGGGLAALAGAILGYPTLRLRGDYLAIMTLGFGEIIRIVANNWVGLTRGPSGISGVPKPALFGFEFQSGQRLYYLALALAALCLILISRMVRSRIGRAWMAIREDEVAAEAMGIHTSRYKLLSYACGAFFAGVMGVFFGSYLNFIHPSNFKLMESITMLALVVLGGMGNLVGPVVGAVIWIAIQEWLRDVPYVQDHPEVRGIAMGAVLVLLMVVRPQGLLGSRRVALEMHPSTERQSRQEREAVSDLRERL